MLKPKYLGRLPDAMVELYSQVETDILADMAKRISVMDDFTPAAQWQYKKLIEMGNYHSFVVKALAARMGKTEAEVKRILEQAGQKALAFDDGVYRTAGLSPPPLAASPALQAVLNTGLESTMGLFENLTRTTANTSTRQFEKALDRAWLQVNSGAFSHQEATRMAIKDLARDGIASIEYPSGHMDKLDVAVRRAVLTGVNQTALKLQDSRAEEMGSDLVEVTAHAGARTGVEVADHAGWQGKVYSRSGTHRKYPSLVEKTGYGTGPGLGGWNCRHSMFPFFEGISEPTYSKAELEALNAPKYEYNGQKLTEEQASQRQRYIERQIRRWRRENAAMKAAGLDTGESSAKLKQWQDTQKDFLRQTGLKRQFDRERAEFAEATAPKKNNENGMTMSAAGGTMDEKDTYAINQYKKSSVSYPLNAALRGESPMTEAQSAIAHDIDQALLKLPTYEGTVYRSLRSEEMVDADAFWGRYAPGVFVPEEGYTSASAEVYDETMDIQMIIQSKRGCDMRAYNPLEQEVLFRRGSMFYVERREGNTLWLTES